MNSLLSLSRRIDAFNERFGRAIAWLLLVAVLVSVLNALSRYGLNASSNAFLELQWYLYGAVFLLCSPWTLRRNEHIRIDLLMNRFSPRVHAWVDIVGGIVFLIPMCVLILWSAVPFALDSFSSGEMSANAGGLIQWPAKAMIPLAFALLAVQGVSETIKRFAFLRGLIDASEFEKGGHFAQQSEPTDPAVAGH